MRKIEDILEGDQMPCFDNLRKEINELQCALAFERDSLSYETKRCKDALAEKDAEIEELQKENSKLLVAIGFWKKDEIAWHESNVDFRARLAEARDWARKLYKENGVDNLIMGIQRENAALRTQLAEAQDDLRFQESVKEVRAVGVADQIRDLCDERDDVRNKTLDEAQLTARRVLFVRSIPHNIILLVCKAILALKS